MLALLACFLGLGVVGGGDVTARTARDRLAGSWAVHLYRLQFPLRPLVYRPSHLTALPYIDIFYTLLFYCL